MGEGREGEGEKGRLRTPVEEMVAGIWGEVLKEGGNRERGELFRVGRAFAAGDAGDLAGEECVWGGNRAASVIRGADAGRLWATDRRGDEKRAYGEGGGAGDGSGIAGGRLAAVVCAAAVVVFASAWTRKPTTTCRWRCG